MARDEDEPDALGHCREPRVVTQRVEAVGPHRRREPNVALVGERVSVSGAGGCSTPS